MVTNSHDHAVLPPNHGALKQTRRPSGTVMAVERARGTMYRSILLCGGIVLVALICLLVSTSSALAASSGVSAWGLNNYGQLGDGYEGGSYESAVPVAVSGLGGVKEIAARGADSLALLNDDTVVAWGANANGQLGNGTEANSDLPVAVSGLTDVTAIAAGGDHNMALLSNGTVMDWGYAEDGILGDGGGGGSSDVPVAVSGLTGVTAIAAGADHSLALLSNGKVMAWGTNRGGDLGNGTTMQSDVPVEVEGLTEVTAIAAGEGYSLALRKNGTVMAWGENEWGTLGDGSEAESSDVPVLVCATGETAPCSHELSGVTAISAGLSNSLALLGDGEVRAWGQNIVGQLGDGSADGSVNAPVAVGDLSEVAAISAGGYHSLAALKNGTVKAWGLNAEAQLGNGSTTGPELCPDENPCSKTPIPVIGLSGVTEIAAGEKHSLAVGVLQGPRVAKVEPRFGTGVGGTSVAITGTNFNEVTAVKFGSIDATSFNVESETEISATSPAGTGVVDVIVETGEGASPTSLADHFSYSPTVSKLNPADGSGLGGIQVAITGTNFNEVTAVKFGSIDATSFNVESETSITAVSPAGTGTVDVTVESQGGTSTITASDQFDYSPTVTGVTPNHGPPSGGSRVTITGTNFTGATVVRFGPVEAPSFEVESDTRIVAEAPAFAGGEEDAAGVYVTTSGGTNEYYGCGTERRAFIYEPTITKVEPHTGLPSGGTQVTITGAAFNGVIWGEEPLCSLATPVLQWVDFGSTPAESVNIVSGSEITAVAPPGAGTVDVTTRDAHGVGSSLITPGDRFSYGPASAKVSPTLATTASPAISLGASVHDTATLADGQSPGGVITFKLYGPNDSSCSNPPAFVSAPVSVAGNGTYESPAFTPSAPGTYRWTASYSGDASNEGVAAACNEPSERMNVRTNPVEVPASIRRLRWSFGQILGRRTVLVRVGVGTCSRDTFPRIHARIRERVRSAVVTLIAHFPAYRLEEHQRCPKIRGRISKRIKLARPVSGLTLYDGSTSPPRRRWPLFR